MGTFIIFLVLLCLFAQSDANEKKCAKPCPSSQFCATNTGKCRDRAIKDGDYFTCMPCRGQGKEKTCPDYKGAPGECLKVDSTFQCFRKHDYQPVIEGIANYMYPTAAVSFLVFGVGIFFFWRNRTPLIVNPNANKSTAARPGKSEKEEESISSSKPEKNSAA